MGNKADLDTRRVISREEGAAYASENGMMYIETSAKSASGVNEAFMGCAQAIYDKMLTHSNTALKAQQQLAGSVNLGDTRRSADKVAGCC